MPPSPPQKNSHKSNEEMSDKEFIPPPVMRHKPKEPMPKTRFKNRPGRTFRLRKTPSPKGGKRKTRHL